MNNNARFFFYIFGFTGYILFFTGGILINGNPIYALVQSAFGCLFFAISGRILLTFFLNGTIQQDILAENQIKSERISNFSGEIDPLQQSSIATSKTAVKTKPLVQTKV